LQLLLFIQIETRIIVPLYSLLSLITVRCVGQDYCDKPWTNYQLLLLSFALKALAFFISSFFVPLLRNACGGIRLATPTCFPVRSAALQLADNIGESWREVLNELLINY